MKKNKLARGTRKLPRASYERRPYGSYSTTSSEDYACAVIPCHSATQARQIIKTAKFLLQSVAKEGEQ